jgi:hypothetical protein
MVITIWEIIIVIYVQGLVKKICKMKDCSYIIIAEERDSEE